MRHNNNKGVLAFCLLAVPASLFLLAVPMAQAQNVRPVLITQNVDESKLVTLAGNTRPEAKKQNDRGLVANNLPMEHMLLQLKRSPEQERELRQLIDELTDSSSPNFHQWLSAKEFGERFGLAATGPRRDYALVAVAWLQGECGVRERPAHRLFRDGGTSAAGVPHRDSSLGREGREAHRQHERSADSGCTGAGGRGSGVIARFHAAHHVQATGETTPSRSNGQTYYAVVPADLATIYNLNPLFSAGISGQGQTVVVIEDSDVYCHLRIGIRSVRYLASRRTPSGSFTQVQPRSSEWHQ